ncbi:MAG: AAA family ATPase [Myxococcota bacterium]
MGKEQFQRLSQSPTRPVSKTKSGGFDVAELYEGPLKHTDRSIHNELPLDEKLRKAYFWIVNEGIISPFYDIAFNTKPPQRHQFGDSRVSLDLPSDQSYSSYVLLPLLNLAVRRRCLLVGGPGRGKTVIATILGVLSGYHIDEVRRGIQHGQPQMTIADLLGNPLPSSLVSAQSMDEVVIAWRKWLGMRIKIIDEYNRIPTRTQSALLTVMSDNYAELYDQIFECPPSAWYLTANDDAGGGTYQVIEALRDRIDVVVKALHFNSRFIRKLLQRVEAGISPEDIVPDEIIFSEAELNSISKSIQAVPIPDGLQRRLEFFVAQFEFFEPGAKSLDYMTKDTVKVAGVPLSSFSADGKDLTLDIGSQTENGVSVRALMTIIVFVKAMAYFRGHSEVSFEDIRQIIPFVLHDKLVQNPDAPFFDQSGHDAFRSDHVNWIRTLFDLSCTEYERLNRDSQDPVLEELELFDKGLDGLSANEVHKRMVRIEKILRQWQKQKLQGQMLDDLLTLKYLHQRYTNYWNWLQCQS